MGHCAEMGISMNIVIVGYGKIGGNLVQRLSTTAHNVTVIDKVQRHAESAMNCYDVIGIEGNGASYAILQEAGADHADFVIALTGTDEVNLLCCMVAKNMGARYTIARVRNPEYLQQIGFMRERLGISMIINPELIVSSSIARILSFPTALNISVFARGRADIIEWKIEEGNKLAGQMISGIHKTYKIKVLICAVQREDEIIIPTGDFVLQEGDHIHVTGTMKSVAEFIKKTSHLKTKTRSAMIVGGSRTGFYLADRLSTVGMEVKLIEQDAERCRVLSESLPEVTVIHGDGSDYELLNEEDIDIMDAFVALTDLDEENVILSMYANKYNVKRILAKVNNQSIGRLLDEGMAGCVFYPQTHTVDRIISFIRGHLNSEGSNVQTLYRILGDRAEALEFVVKKDNNNVGIPLKNLQLKDNVLLANIIRGNKIIIPGGDDVIEVGDSVVVVTTNMNLRDFNDIMKK